MYLSGKDSAEMRLDDDHSSPLLQEDQPLFPAPIRVLYLERGVPNLSVVWKYNNVIIIKDTPIVLYRLAWKENFVSTNNDYKIKNYCWHFYHRYKLINYRNYTSLWLQSVHNLIGEHTKT